MSNTFYDYGRQGFLDASINWLADDIRLVLLDSTLYSPSLSTEKFLQDIPSAAQVAISDLFFGKTVDAGVADAFGVTVRSVVGATVGAFAIFKDTGSPTTSRLIAYFDSASGLPATPSGGDISIEWDSGPARIFKL